MKAICLLKKHGYVEFDQKNIDQPLKIHFHFSGFSPHSTHAIHIHEYGDLRNGCLSLGGHFNPTDSIHGSMKNPHHHLGDLMNNFKTDEEGNYEKTLTFPHLSLFNESPFSILGRSIVIHKHPDDEGLQEYWKTHQSYDDLSLKELQSIILQLGYSSKLTSHTESAMKKLLNKESLESGNAGQRIDCGIIGRCAS